MKYTILADGNLKIEPSDEEELEAIRELSEEELNQDKFMFDFFEDITCNGLSWVLPEQISALTDAPILSDRMPDLEKGEFGELDKDALIWWYPNYQVRSPLQDIREYGSCIFNKAESWE